MTPFDYALQRWRIRKASPFIHSGSSVLDIGSSDGVLYRHLPKIGSYVGIDPLVAEETRTVNYTLVRGFFPAQLPDDRRFDAITMLAVLEHIPAAQQQTLAANCFEYLKPGGLVVVTVPSEQVDLVLKLLRFLRLVHGMSLEEHYGFKARDTPAVFKPSGFRLLQEEKFQLGMNNLFVFEKPVQARAWQ